MKRLRTASAWPWRIAALVFAVMVFAALLHFFPTVLKGIEERSGGVLWRLNPIQADEQRVILVDIDERSLHEVGPWPWSREKMAQLAQQLGEQGASQQIYDMVFPDARPDDARLTQAFRQQPTILAQVFDLNAGSQVELGQLQAGLSQPTCQGAPFPQAISYIGNTATLRGANAGHITPRIASDGAVRHIPALICHQKQAYPALALAALLQGGAPQASPLKLEAGLGGLDAAWYLSLPGFRIPLDHNGDIRVPYRLDPKSFVSVPAADILNGRVPKGLFDGAWALVGTTAFGLNDAVPTPHGGAAAGLGVHAQLLTALLDNRVPYTPQAAPLIHVLLALLGVGVLLCTASRRRALPVYVLPTAAALLAVGLFVLQGGLLLRASIWLGWVQPAAFIVLSGLSLTVAESARVRFERERLFGHLSSYLPESVAKALALQPASDAIEAERREVTVMFADIRNFSAYCEACPPEESAALLHTFFADATRIVEAHGGMIESFQGDAVMAIWTGEYPVEAPVQAAQSLHLAASQWLDTALPEGVEPLDLGIGMERGPALIGSFGPARRRTHTALGQTVTIAARLQALTADLAQPVLLGQGSAAALPAEMLLPQGSFLLEGLNHPYSVYAVSSAIRTVH